MRIPIDFGNLLKPSKILSSNDVPGDRAATTALFNYLISLRTYGLHWTLYIDAKPTDHYDGKILQEHDDRPPPGVCYMRVERELTEAQERDAKRRAKAHWICVSAIPRTFSLKILADIV
jgi:hypothetical protein